MKRYNKEFNVWLGWKHIQLVVTWDWIDLAVSSALLAGVLYFLY